MIDRYYDISKELEGSIFLFGARQTGKSTLLRQQLKTAILYDLLDGTLRRRFQSDPSLLYKSLIDKDENTIVVIDEIPEAPELLNEVHRLISEKGIRFVLCGSSARKLRRKGYNTLGGRAFPCFFYPLISAELPNLDLDRGLIFGFLPRVYLAQNPRRELSSYIDVYLKEEIQQEAIVRNLDSFQRFLEVAALTNGEIVNYSNIASDCGVSAVTVKEYFSILQDTLIGYLIPAYRKVVKRKLSQAPRFYFFDTGVVNYLLHRESVSPKTSDYGRLFEQFIVMELKAYMGYHHKRQELSYWHTYTGQEVDIIIGDAQIAIEIKSTEDVQHKHLSGLKGFAEEHPNCRKILVSRDIISRREGDIELIYFQEFLRRLWNGELF